MDIDELYHKSNISRTSSNEMNDRDSASETSRKISVTSSKSTGLCACFLKTMCISFYISFHLTVYYQFDLRDPNLNWIRCCC